MREVILHVGMHKTGSSSIQNSLKHFDDTKTRYAQFDYANHSIPIFTIFSEKRQSYHIWKKMGYSPGHIEELRRDYLFRLNNQLSDYSRERLIFSGEDICLLRDHEKYNLLQNLQRGGKKLTLICFTRHPQDYAISIFQQMVKGGLDSIRTINPDYQFNLKYFYETCYESDFIVKDFTTENAKYGDITKAFCSLASINPELVTPIRVNESLSASALKLIYSLNRSFIKTFGSNKKFKARQNTIMEFSKAFPISDDASKIDSKIAGGLVRCQSDELEFIYKAFNILYELENNRTSIHGVHEYMSDLSDVDLEKLEMVLNNLEIPTSKLKNIEEAVKNIYEKIYESND